MACGICDRKGHNAQTCPHDAPRIPVRKKRASTCECCGSNRYETHAHHTRGRGDPSDSLDLCTGRDGCHLQCGHAGDFQNLPRKPRACQLTGRRSAWRRRTPRRTSPPRPRAMSRKDDVGVALLAGAIAGAAVWAIENPERAREAVRTTWARLGALGPAFLRPAR
jgi:hypothetical protein